LVGEGLPLLLPRRGEAIGQTTEIVVIVRVFRTGFSCSPHAAILGLELRGQRGGDQSEIVFGALKIVLGGDRIVARVSVARQLKVFFSYVQRGPAWLLRGSSSQGSSSLEPKRRETRSLCFACALTAHGLPKDVTAVRAHILVGEILD
jgi:hypothetical protein